jgi:hypothetical protein
MQRLIQPPPLVLNVRAAIQTISNHPAWLTHDSLPVVNRSGIFQGVLRRSKVIEEEQALMTQVTARNELATTRSALADVFWIGMGALFVNNNGAVAQDKAED